MISYNSKSGLAIYRGHGKPKDKISARWTPLTSSLKKIYPPFHGRHGQFDAAAGIKLIVGFAKSVSEGAANRMLSGKQPLIPQERFTLDELIELYYTT